MRIDNCLKIFALVLVLAANTAKGELVAHWKLDKTNDSRVIDSSGKGNDGSLVDMSRYVTGVFGQALDFDGVSQVVRLPYNTILMPSKQITISAWIRPDQTEGTNRTIYWKGGGNGAQHTFGFFGGGADVVLGLGIDGTFTQLRVAGQASAFMDGQWHLLTGTYNGWFMRLYKDGLQIGGKPIRGKLSVSGTEDSYIGGPSEYFDGSIDDVRIYNHALNSDEIVGLYLEGKISSHEPLLKTLFESADQAKLLLKNKKSDEAVNLLESILAQYEQHKDKNATDIELFYKILSSDLYLLLARAKEDAGKKPAEVAKIYQKVIELGPVCSSNYASALIWLIKHNRTKQCREIIKPYVQSSMIDNSFSEVVSNVSKYYEYNNNFNDFSKFLDVLLSISKHPFDWAVFVESCLNEQTETFAKLSDYLNNQPRQKFGWDWVAEKHIAAGNFKKAAELYQQIINNHPTSKKQELEFRLCECLFYGGRYRQAVNKLEKLITNYKAKPNNIIKKAMLLKGRGYIQLGELEKARVDFFDLVLEYQEISDADFLNIMSERQVGYDTIEVNFFVGYSYMLEGKFEAAVETFEAIMRNCTDSSYIGKARMCMTWIKDMQKELKLKR